MSTVAIVGAGIAGLSTAYELHKRGVSFAVFESGSRAGGVVLSEQVEGYVVDGGPDALLVSKPDGIRLCEELGLGSRLVPTKRPRVAYIQRAGRLHPLPAASVLGIPTEISPFVGTRLFTWAGKLRMGAELFVPPRRDDADESIGAFIARRFGSEAVTYLAEPLLAGIHAGDVDRLSVRALFPRLVEAERTHGSLIRAFRRQRRLGGNGAFRSLPEGLSEMVRALVRALPADSIRLQAPVKEISRAPGGFRVEGSSGEALSAKAVVLATPAYVTATILQRFDPDLCRFCEAVPYASTATVALAFERQAVRHPLQGSGFVVPKVENTGILAATWLSSKWPHRAPDDRLLLRTFVGGARDPHALESSDTELIALSLKALGPLLGISGEPLLARVYRWQRASAQHEVGHLERLAAFERRLLEHSGLFVTGSGFRGVGIPDCVADGRAIGKQVTDWLAGG